MSLKTIFMEKLSNQTVGKTCKYAYEYIEELTSLLNQRLDLSSKHTSIEDVEIALKSIVGDKLDTKVFIEEIRNENPQYKHSSIQTSIYTSIRKSNLFVFAGRGHVRVNPKMFIGDEISVADDVFSKTRKGRKSTKKTGKNENEITSEQTSLLSDPVEKNVEENDSNQTVTSNEPVGLLPPWVINSSNKEVERTKEVSKSKESISRGSSEEQKKVSFIHSDDLKNLIKSLSETQKLADIACDRVVHTDKFEVTKSDKQFLYEILDQVSDLSLTIKGYLLDVDRNK